MIRVIYCTNQRISFSEWRRTITDSSPKEERFQPHTRIDFEAEKAAKRLAESRCQDVTFTVVIPAGLTTTTPTQKKHRPWWDGTSGAYNLLLNLQRAGGATRLRGRLHAGQCVWDDVMVTCQLHISPELADGLLVIPGVQQAFQTKFIKDWEEFATSAVS